ncbi:FAD-binding oxidoreductase [Leeia sp. TBRC 13508]|uniref:FAD-binding oxidoreductase n=1 Tax=Leeia speluncae TaxID=2884804 RepID=A0ABS8D9Z6_9NEIS|nr:FAD-binding oxidoreductase [Leeia speluncae]MCB6185034.1 FAD-binding oxidoreductase [Leeia speluncae]
MSVPITAFNYPCYEVFNASLPQEADVVIAGAGIMGLATAYYLAKRGLSVVITDKSRIAGQQSNRAWGWVRQQGRDPAEVPLMQASNQIWQTLAQELNGDIEWRQQGCLYAGETAEDMASHEAWLPIAKDHQLDTRLITSSEVSRLVPGLATSVKGGLYTASDGQAEPRRVAPLFAKRAQELGAIILEGNGVTGIETENGRISGVQTERGLIKTKHFVCTSGASSWRLLQLLDIQLPQHIVRGSVSRTSPGPAISGTTYLGNNVGIRQRSDGTFNLAEGAQVDIDITLGHLRGLEWYLGPLWQQRSSFRFNLNGAFLQDIANHFPFSEASQNGKLIHIRDPHLRPNDKIQRQSLAALKQSFPNQKNVQILETWAGGIDVVPDGIPVIDAPSNHPGLLIATGFCGHGFAMGPIVGKLLSNWIVDGEPGMNLHAFRLAKYAEKDLKPPYSLF